MHRMRILVSILFIPALLATGCSDSSTDPGTGATTGTIQVNPPQDGPGDTTPWTLDGPNNYQVARTGQETIEDLLPGSYTVTWGDVAGWDTPAADTRSLVVGRTLAFTCSYELDTTLTTISVQVVPTSLHAPWTLSGPGAFSRRGTGSTEIVGLQPGDYTIDWGAVTNRSQPLTETKTLDSPRVEFVGDYQLDYPFPGSPEQLMSNFEVANEVRDYEGYLSVLDSRFRIFLMQETVVDFGLPKNFFEYAEDILITDKMFSGVSPSPGVGAISDIEFVHLSQIDSWDVTDNIEFPGALESQYDVSIRIMQATGDGTRQLNINGRIIFFLSTEQVMYDGRERTLYHMVGQIDATSMGKPSEDVSWSDVKALYQ